MAAAKKSGFVVGDVVVLNSGGPKMSVTEVRELPEGAMVFCTWFAGKKKEHGSFRSQGLEHAPTESEADDED